MAGKGKRIGFNDEVPQGKNQDETGHLNTTADEKYTSGTNDTKPHTHNKPPKGPYGSKSTPNKGGKK